MNAKRILYATDFSDYSKAALPFASALAAGSGARLYIVYVDDLPDAYVPGFEAGYGGHGYVPDLYNDRHEIRDQLAQIKPTVDGVEFDHCYLRGHVADEILKFSQQENVDMIVIGSHGRTGMSRLLLGSVAEAIVRRAKCPVLTIKHPPPPSLLPDGEE